MQQYCSTLPQWLPDIYFSCYNEVMLTCQKKEVHEEKEPHADHLGRNEDDLFFLYFWNSWYIVRNSLNSSLERSCLFSRLSLIWLALFFLEVFCFFRDCSVTLSRLSDIYVKFLNKLFIPVRLYYYDSSVRKPGFKSSGSHHPTRRF